MSRNISRLLCVALIALLLATIFVGCNPKGESDANKYVVTVTDNNGAPVKGVGLTVLKDNDEFTSGTTDDEGKFAFEADLYVYSVLVKSVPSGYIPTDAVYKTSDQERALTIALDKIPPASGVGDDEYGVKLKSVGGAALRDVPVSVSLDNELVAEGVTDFYGLFKFKGEPASYSVKVGELPTGYKAFGNNTFVTSADSNVYEISFESELTAAPIENKTYHEGDIFFDFEMKDVMKGDKYRLSEVLQQKKAVLINFWNSHCGPCLSEMPGLNIAYQEYKDSVEVLAISVILYDWDTEAEVLQTAAGMNPQLEYPLFADGTSAGLLNSDDVTFTRYLSLGALPTSIVIDRYGMLAYIDSGSMGTDQFKRLFEKYSADDYVQDNLFGGGEGGEEPELERVEPDKQQADSADIEQAINGDGFTGHWYPESGTDDAKYSWPWEVDTISDGGKDAQVLKPANHAVSYSFATIKTKVSIPQSAIDEGGNIAMVFDLKYSTEDNNDEFFVVVNNKLVYTYTGTEHWGSWQHCYPFVADEAGDYEVTLLYNKDALQDGGYDTVYVKDVRLIPTSQITDASLDMPRDAAKQYDSATKTFKKYVNVVYGSDGLYHANDADGPYLLADLQGVTAFSSRGFERTVSEASVAGLFDYGDKGDKTKAITKYLMPATNSSLPGLITVNNELKELLNEFAKSIYPECDDKAWLEFCIWFEHFGTDEKDSGINTPDRDPVRGLSKDSAIPMADVFEGEFEEMLKIPNQYKNKVVIDRIIVPRGIMYKLVPDKSGAYRFNSQSSNLSDTMAWLRDESMDSYDEWLVATDAQREDPYDYKDLVEYPEYNFTLTWYLEEGKSYYLSVAFADVGGTGEFTFTTEYLGPSTYIWEHVAQDVVTYTDTGSDLIIGDMVNLYNAYPVLDESDGYYYDAKRGADGKPLTDGNGNMIPDRDDPIYVDFFDATHFMPSTLDSTLLMGETSGNERSVLSMLQNRVLPLVFGEDIGSKVTRYTRLESLNGNKVLTSEQWEQLRTAISSVYGDTVYIDDYLMESLSACVTVQNLITFLQDYYLKAFDFSTRRDVLVSWGYPASLAQDYTNTVKKYRDKAAATLSSPEYPDRGGNDAGCVRLDQELQIILELFANRYGWEGSLKTDWVRLCKHYEYIGAYRG